MGVPHWLACALSVLIWITPAAAQTPSSRNWDDYDRTLARLAAAGQTDRAIEIAMTEISQHLRTITQGDVAKGTSNYRRAVGGIAPHLKDEDYFEIRMNSAGHVGWQEEAAREFHARELLAIIADNNAGPRRSPGTMFARC
jgi:hypothetical protein